MNRSPQEEDHSQTNMLGVEVTPIPDEQQINIKKFNEVDDVAQPDNVQLEFGQPEAMLSDRTGHTASTLARPGRNPFAV